MIEIVTYRGDDVEYDTAIAALLKKVYVDAGFTSPEIAAKMFAAAEVKKRGKIILALDGQKSPVGMIIVGTHGNPYKQVATEGEAEMQLLGSSPAVRGQGVGEALCRAFEKQALIDGLKKAVLSTQPAMAAAHKLYLKLGYERNPDRDWERNDRKFLVFEKNL